MKISKLLYYTSSRIVHATVFVILTILMLTNLRFSTYVMNIKENISVQDTNLFLQWEQILKTINILEDGMIKSMSMFIRTPILIGKNRRKDGARIFKYYKKYPEKAYQFFSKKITTTWADPLYESIFSGPKQEAGQYVYPYIFMQIPASSYVIVKIFEKKTA